MYQSSMSRRRLITLAGASALGLSLGNQVRIQTAHAALADSYELIDLGVTGVAPRPELGLFFMNDQGVAVGTTFVDIEKDSPWYWRDGELTRIKTGKFGARITSVNRDGLMGGREIIRWESETVAIGRPVLWIDGEKEVLPYPDGVPGTISGGAIVGISDAGTAFGYVMTEDSLYYPVSWTDGNASLLETIYPEGQGWVNVVNSFGGAFGQSVGSTESIGTLWDAGSLLPVQYETIEGMTDWTIIGLDDAGRLLGHVSMNGVQSAAWSDMAFAQPQLLPAVNGQQEASLVGCSDGAGLLGGSITVGGKEHGVIWNDGEGIELKSLVKSTKGLRLLAAESITSSGVIAGDAVDGDGNRHPVILMPI
jgi:hypothetical protein